MAGVPTSLLPEIYSLNGMLRKFWPEHAITNECAFKKAAVCALPDLVDDDNAFQVIARFVRTGQEDRFGTMPSDA